jgi:hypothetical protein
MVFHVFSPIFALAGFKAFVFQWFVNGKIGLYGLLLI